MKIFEFLFENIYCVAAQNREVAEIFFKENFNDEFSSVEEIPEEHWDNKFISIYEDNNTENEPFKVSIRDIMCGEEPQLIYTTDQDII